MHQFSPKIELFLQIIILISIMDFTIETLPTLSETAYWWLWLVEAISVVIFTIEYIGRLYFSKNKRVYVFSFFGLIDLVSILPFWISLGVDLRFLKVLRVFRAARILKLTRYNCAMERYKRAFIETREELTLFFFATFVMLYFVSVGIYYFENEAQPEAFKSVFHAFWWAICTLTTVGFGDVYPITPAGKVFTTIILLIGLAVVAVPSGVIASALTSQGARD